MLIKELYDCASFDALKASVGQTMFKDSSAGIVLARNLVHISPKILEKQYPELGFVNSGVTVNNEGGYAAIITSLRVNSQGSFRNSKDDAENKGKISIVGEDSSISVIERLAESSWTDSEINEAALQNINLVEKFLAAHLKVYNNEVDESGYLGIGTATGLLNNTTFTSENAAAAATTFTGQELYDEIADFIVNQHNAVSNAQAYKADRVDMPTSVLNIATRKILNSAGSEMSVLKALKANFPDITFTGTFRGEAAVTGSTSSTCAYSSNEDSVVFRLPLPLTIGEIIRLGSFNFHVDSKYRLAGLDILDSTGGRLLRGL